MISSVTDCFGGKDTVIATISDLLWMSIAMNAHCNIPSILHMSKISEKQINELFVFKSLLSIEQLNTICLILGLPITNIFPDIDLTNSEIKKFLGKLGLNVGEKKLAPIDYHWCCNECLLELCGTEEVKEEW